MLDSIDLFLKAVDRIIQLINVRNENERRLFKEVIDPLFHDLEPVVTDYFSFFSRTLDLLKSATPENMSSITAEVRAMREKQLIARSKVRQFALALGKKTKDPLVREFAINVYGIFYPKGYICPRLDEGISMPSAVVDLFEAIETKPLNKKMLIGIISSAPREIENSWGNVAAAYADLRLRCTD